MTMTTVGYGDVLPTTVGEKGFVCVCMVLGGAYFGYMIALMVEVVAKQDANKALFNERVDGARSWTEARNLPRDLQLRVRLEGFLSPSCRLAPQRRRLRRCCASWRKRRRSR